MEVLGTENYGSDTTFYASTTGEAPVSAEQPTSAYVHGYGLRIEIPFFLRLLFFLQARLWKSLEYLLLHAHSVRLFPALLPAGACSCSSRHVPFLACDFACVYSRLRTTS